MGAGEDGTATWNLSTRDSILECLHFDWSQLKTSKQKGLVVVIDYEGFEMDVYHSMACFSMASFGHINAKEDQNWIFPAA